VKPGVKRSVLGDVKWFGGHNARHAGENDYGFLSTPGGDVYVHRSQILSPPEALTEGTKVVFVYVDGKRGRPAAGSVRALSLMSEEDLLALFRESESSVRQEALKRLISSGAKETLLEIIGDDQGPLPPGQALAALKRLDSGQLLSPRVSRALSQLSPADKMDLYCGSPQPQFLAERIAGLLNESQENSAPLRQRILERLSKRALVLLLKCSTGLLTEGDFSILRESLGTRDLLCPEAAFLRGRLSADKRLELLCELDTLSGFDDEALETVREALALESVPTKTLDAVWARFAPKSKDSPLYPFLPGALKRAIWRETQLPALPIALRRRALVREKDFMPRADWLALAIRMTIGADDPREVEELLEVLPTEGLVSFALTRGELPPYEKEILRAVSLVSAEAPLSGALEQFWRQFPPSSPKDPFFDFAPSLLKARICKNYYSLFKDGLGSLFASLAKAAVSLPAPDVYERLDEKDSDLAAYWAKDDSESEMARMLSARAAEKATKQFYERAGLSVEDVSIGQLAGESSDWITHDLLVDSRVAVDVKNARRPVNNKNFYVEHTVPQFKVVRRNENVRIAGILSPYLKLEYIKCPYSAPFKIADVVFLGETSRDIMERLAATFDSPSFEVSRGYERTFPHWQFEYPRAWYRAFAADLQHLTSECEWPDGEEWNFVFDDSERLRALPALCVTGRPLPAALASHLSSWQRDFYSKMQRLAGNPPSLPGIFLTVLTDFIARLKGDPDDFSPQGYLPLLFAGNSETPAAFTLGTIDPLHLVHALVATLTILWENRRKTNLERFSSFKLSGLGLLQGREKQHSGWTTIIAYCGGIVYAKGDKGKVLLTPDGKPRSVMGKCGQSPLVIGQEQTCSACGKLVCGKCGFCSQHCQEQAFQELAESAKRESAHHSNRGFPGLDDGATVSIDWEIPIEAYEDEFRRYELRPDI